MGKDRGEQKSGEKLWLPWQPDSARSASPIGARLPLGFLQGSPTLGLKQALKPEGDLKLKNQLSF